MGSIAQNLSRIKEDILRNFESTGINSKLIAVTKGVPPERVREAVEAGQLMFGENYVQEALSKMEALRDVKGIAWHFIGHLQSNKAKYCINKFSMVQSVDREKVAVELDKEAVRNGIAGFPVLIEVNISGEASKSGICPLGLSNLLARISELKGIKVKGLMTMPPYFEDPEGSRKYFKALREIAQGIEDKNAYVEISEFSMGLSHDYKIALEEGATMIRVGTAIFGKRDQ